MTTEHFLATALAAEELIATDVVVAAWARPSALDGYLVGGLAGHLARAVLTVPQYLDAPEPADGPSIDAAGYFATVLADHDPVGSPLHRKIRTRGEDEATDGPAALVERMTAAREQLAASLDAATLVRGIQVLDGHVLTVDQYLRTRLTELVVHLDGLAVSVDADVRPSIPEEAYVRVSGVLGQVAARRIGGLATVRSLARAERHPDPVRAM